MGGGGPAGFLNKKPWHPGRFQNQEEVWKREQKAAAEQKKLEELRQQYEDERKNQEIIQIAQDAGHGKKGDRLDWMYAGSLAAKEDAAKRQEEALLGQRAATLTGATQPMEISRAEVASALPTVHAVALPASQNEEWNRLNNDPLLLIKRQQHEQLKRIKENPIKMQEILKEVQQERLKHKEKKSKKHKAKKDKKRKRSGSGSDSSGGKQPPHASQPFPDAHGRGHGNAGQPMPGHAWGRDGHTGRPHPYQGEVWAGHRQAAAGGAGSHGRDTRSPPPGRHGLHREERGSTRQHSGLNGSTSGSGHGQGGPLDGSGMGRGAEGEGGRGERGRQEGGDAWADQQQRWQGEEKQRSRRERDGERGRLGRHDDTRHQAGEDDRPHGPHGPQRYPSQSAQGGRSPPRGADSKRHSKQAELAVEGQREHEGCDRQPGGKRQLSAQEAAMEEGEGGAKRPSSQAGPTKAGYGLSHNMQAPEAVQKYDTSSRAADTRARLEEASRRKAEEERVKAAQKGVRKEYKAGKISEEDRARKLAEMASNAEQHDAARLSRLHRAKQDEDAAEQAQGVVANVSGVAGTAREGDSFLKAASRDVYSALAGSSLEGRVNSRKHFVQR